MKENCLFQLLNFITSVKVRIEMNEGPFPLKCKILCISKTSSKSVDILYPKRLFEASVFFGVIQYREKVKTLYTTVYTTPNGLFFGL